MVSTRLAVALPRLTYPGTTADGGTSSLTRAFPTARNLTTSQPPYSIKTRACGSLHRALPAQQRGSTAGTSPPAGMPLKVAPRGRQTWHQWQIFSRWPIWHITLGYSALGFCLGNFDFCLGNLVSLFYPLCSKWQSEPCHWTLLSLTFTTSCFNKITFADTLDSGS